MAKPKQADTGRVFLSHSTLDRWVSERIKDKIEESGTTVWLDAFDLSGLVRTKKN